MDRQILEDILTFAGIIVAMGCFTGIVISLIKRRSPKPLPTGDLTHRLDEIVDRLSRLENAVDSSAVEIERISEGQRFTTKLLSERVPVPSASDKDRPAGPPSPR